MKSFFVAYLTLLTCLSFAQTSGSVADVHAELKATLHPVYQPSRETGAMVVEVPIVMVVNPKSLPQNPPEPKLSVLEASNWTAETREAKVKVVAVGLNKEANSLLVYLADSVSMVPKLTFGRQEVCPLGTESLDPASIVKPKSFSLLGFQPSAQLTDGSTAGVYQIGLNMPFSSQMKLTGVLSSNMKDKQANIALEFIPAKNFKIQATSSQLGTSQMLTAGYERTSFSGPEYPFNYKGEVSPRFSSTTGVYFTRQLRVDTDVSGGADPGSGIYAAHSFSMPAAFDASGFMKFNFSLNLYYFPSSTADKFGVKQFEPAFDLGTLIPLQRPNQLKNGGWTDGMWLKLGLIQGVQPGNAFGKVSGFRFDIVESF